MPIRLAYLAAALSLVATPALADIQIHVDKTAQTLTVSRDGEFLHRWPVSTGRSGRFTPAGNFRAFRMEKDHYSREFDDAPMPYSIFFTQRGHAIHGSYDTRKLGRPASGGCVRLAPENARVLYDLVQAEGVLKTKVTISGDERVAIARAKHEASPPQAALPAAALPPRYVPDQNARPRQLYAAPAPQYQQPQQYYYDGYQWRPYNGPSYRVAPQPYYESRGYPPPAYYDRGRGGGYYGGYYNE